MLLKRLSGLLNRVIHESRKSRLRNIVDSAPVPEGASPESVEAYRAALRGDLKRAGTILKAPGEERAREDRIIWFLRWSKVFRLAERGVADSPDARLWWNLYRKEEARLLKRGGNPEGDLSIEIAGDRVRSDVPNNLAHYLSLGVRSIEEYAFQSQLPDDLFDDLDTLEETWAKNQRRLIDEERQVEEEGPAEDLLVFPDGWKWRRLLYACSKMEKRAMGHCGNCAEPRDFDEILSLREPIRRGARVLWKPHATFILNLGRLGEMKGFKNEKPGKELHPYIVELLKDADLIKALDGGGFLPQNNFALEDLTKRQYEEVVAANPNLLTVSGKYERYGLSPEVWAEVKSVAESGNDGSALVPEGGDEIPSRTGWYRIYRGDAERFVKKYLPDHPMVRYGYEYLDAPSLLISLLKEYRIDRDEAVERAVQAVVDDSSGASLSMLCHILSLDPPRDVDRRYWEIVTGILRKLDDHKDLKDRLAKLYYEAYARRFNEALRSWYVHEGVDELRETDEVRDRNVRIEQSEDGFLELFISEAELIALVTENDRVVKRAGGLVAFLFRDNLGISDDEEEDEERFVYRNRRDEEPLGGEEDYRILTDHVSVDEDDVDKNVLVEKVKDYLEDRLREGDYPPWEGIDLMDWAFRKLLKYALERPELQNGSYNALDYLDSWVDSLKSGVPFRESPRYKAVLEQIHFERLPPESILKLDAAVEAGKAAVEDVLGEAIPWPPGKPSDILNDVRDDYWTDPDVREAYLRELNHPELSQNLIDRWVRIGRKTYLAPLFQQGIRPCYVGTYYAVGFAPVGSDDPDAWAYLRLADFFPEMKWVDRAVLNAGLTEEDALDALQDVYGIVLHNTKGELAELNNGSRVYYWHVSSLEELHVLPVGPIMRVEKLQELIRNDDLSNLLPRMESDLREAFLRKTWPLLKDSLIEKGIPLENPSS